MKKNHLTSLTAVILLAFSAGAMAQTMSKSEYKASKNSISAEYKATKQKCGSLSGNANDICEAEAKGNDNIAKAELEAQYEPSEKARYTAWVAKADAHYTVAKDAATTKPTMRKTYA